MNIDPSRDALIAVILDDSERPMSRGQVVTALGIIDAGKADAEARAGEVVAHADSRIVKRGSANRRPAGGCRK